MDRLDNIVRETFDYRSDGQPISLPTMRDCLFVRPIPNPGAWTTVLGSIAYCCPQNVLVTWQADMMAASGSGWGGAARTTIRGGVARWGGTNYTEIPVYEVSCVPYQTDLSGSDNGGLVYYDIPTNRALYYPSTGRILSFMSYVNGVKRSAYSTGLYPSPCHLPTGYTMKQCQHVLGYHFFITRHSATEFRVSGAGVRHADVDATLQVSSIFNINYALALSPVGTVTREESTFGTLDTMFFRISSAPFVDFRLIAVNLQAI